ncbi:hypothetical protein ACP70R_034944 [Stipagrostis hirtigluma subsp. patula]
MPPLSDPLPSVPARRRRRGPSTSHAVAIAACILPDDASPCPASVPQAATRNHYSAMLITRSTSSRLLYSLHDRNRRTASLCMALPAARSPATAGSSLSPTKSFFLQSGPLPPPGIPQSSPQSIAPNPHLSRSWDSWPSLPAPRGFPSPVGTVYDDSAAFSTLCASSCCCCRSRLPELISASGPFMGARQGA